MQEICMGQVVTASKLVIFFENLTRSKVDSVHDARKDEKTYVCIFKDVSANPGKSIEFCQMQAYKHKQSMQNFILSTFHTVILLDYPATFSHLIESLFPANKYLFYSHAFYMLASIRITINSIGLK